ncbi:MAG: inositol-3-phosphate synthase [Nitrospiraceae bacterium]|nr:inositol-3-phosphate synthase [Nitrospiraceae bacterium]
MAKIKVAIVGVGNCASSLIQGIEYYRTLGVKHPDAGLGLMHAKIGPYGAGDIEVAAAFDIDERKVGKPLTEAVYAAPNCTKPLIKSFARKGGPRVEMGHILDGISPHMADYPEQRRFVAARKEPVDVAKALKKSGARIVINYVPVGSEQAARFYAEEALKAGAGFINCMPVFIASDGAWSARFRQKGLPVIGDDVKSQMGATIIHRALTKLFEDRGVKLDRTYQLNVGGNTDFLNMLNATRLKSKKISKTQSVQSQMNTPLRDDDIHIGPSDYIPWLLDNKVCFMRMEARIFGNIPINLELRLSVEDSPNSAGVVIDAIRCMALALDRGEKGALLAPSAYFMKHPPEQFPDALARSMVEDFIQGKSTA